MSEIAIKALQAISNNADWSQPSVSKYLKQSEAFIAMGKYEAAQIARAALEQLEDDMPRKNTVLVSTNLTPEQREVVRLLAGAEEQAAYLRRLIAEDAQQRGVAWPDHPGRGKYERKPAQNAD